MIKKICVALAVLILSACAVTKEDLKQDHDLVSALRAANQSDRDVATAKQGVKVATAGLATANAALVVAQQNQKKAHANFEALYQPAPPPQPAQPGEK